MTDAAFYWLWLSSMPRMTRAYMNRLLAEYETPEEIYRAPKQALSCLLPEAVMAEWDRYREQGRIERLIRELERRHITFLYWGHPAYPEHLCRIPDPPRCLYIKGSLQNAPDRHVAIVGSRNATPYGIMCAQYFAGELAKRKIGVVSGLAIGIDGAAHQGALDAGGYTVGFIAGGIDSLYPRQNYHLYLEMEQRGAVVSEYPPTVKPLGRLFPERNRLISGFGDCVLVIEAAKRSGTLITVDQGLEQGKNIYAVPGRIFDPNSSGCIGLIRDGARPVCEVADILEDMGWHTICDDNSDHKKELTENSLAQSEKMVYSCLSLDPVYVDDIVQMSHMSVSQVLSTLLALELKGYISQPVKNYYRKRI